MVDNKMTGNGDGVGFEHGIYVGATADNYTIARNQIGANAGADVKAAGGPGLVADNRLTSSMFGLVISDNPAVVHSAVQPRPGQLPARDPDHDGRDARTCAALEQHRPADGALDRERQRVAVFIVSAAQLEAREQHLRVHERRPARSAFLLNDQTLVDLARAGTN